MKYRTKKSFREKECREEKNRKDKERLKKILNLKNIIFLFKILKTHLQIIFSFCADFKKRYKFQKCIWGRMKGMKVLLPLKYVSLKRYMQKNNKRMLFFGENIMCFFGGRQNVGRRFLFFLQQRQRMNILLWELIFCLGKALLIVFSICTGLCILFIIWKFHSPLLFRDLGMYDEGVTLLGAKRFAQGDFPYRDFFTIYGPMKFSLLGGVFSLFGETVYVSRLFFAVISLIGFFTIFLFFLRESNVFLATLFTLFLALIGKVSLTPLFLILIAYWFFVTLDAPQKPFLPFLGGVLLGILFLLRLDFGVFTALSIFALLISFFLCSRQYSFSLFSSVIGKILLGFSCVVFPFFGLLFSYQALSDFWMQTIVFPLFGTYQDLRHLPWLEFSSLRESINGHSVDFLEFSKAFSWFFWPIPFVLAGVFWIFQILRRRFCIHAFLKNMLLASFVVAGFLYASHRSDHGHIMFLNFLAVIFLLHLFLQWRNRFQGIFFIVPLLFLFSLYPLHSLLEARAFISESEKTMYSFFPKEFPMSQENDDLQKTLDYFSSVSQNDKVFVGIKDTSRVFVNNVMLPFLLEQPVATKYHELHTGIVTTLPVQKEMIDELRDVRHVVLWDLFVCEPNDGCMSTNVRLLDEYITVHFEHIQTYGKYEIYMRKK
jgi:hypothetical protein